MQLLWQLLLHVSHELWHVQWRQRSAEEGYVLLELERLEAVYAEHECGLEQLERTPAVFLPEKKHMSRSKKPGGLTGASIACA